MTQKGPKFRPKVSKMRSEAPFGRTLGTGGPTDLQNEQLLTIIMTKGFQQWNQHEAHSNKTISQETVLWFERLVGRSWMKKLTNINVFVPTTLVFGSPFLQP